ncbi:MAG: hypothetical protein NUV47_01145 [Patescibacteria group bacterium]|nr:hypothetical protein [Patescibacteria group bacterium]
MEKVTLEKLKEFKTVFNAIDWAKNQYGDYPKIPTKPILSLKHTLTDLKTYNNAFMQYDKEKITYDENLKTYKKRQYDIDCTIIDYIKEEAGLNDTVPEKYRDKIYQKAYSDGHSNGYYEIYINLCELVDIFE